MGYYTRFVMKVVGEFGEVDSAFVKEFEEKNLYDNTMSVQDLIDQSIDTMKWYDHKEEMIEFSRKYPELVFILDGDGEEGGDIWREFYKNGKFYRWEPKIDPPEFSKKIKSMME